MVAILRQYLGCYIFLSCWRMKNITKIKIVLGSMAESLLVFKSFPILSGALCVCESNCIEAVNERLASFSTRKHLISPTSSITAHGRKEAMWRADCASATCLPVHRFSVYHLLLGGCGLLFLFLHWFYSFCVRAMTVLEPVYTDALTFCMQFVFA